MSSGQEVCQRFREFPSFEFLPILDRKSSVRQVYHSEVRVVLVINLPGPNRRHGGGKDRGIEEWDACSLLSANGREPRFKPVIGPIEDKLTALLPLLHPL